MYYDLNVVWPAQVQSTSAAGAGAASSNEALKSKKQKGKQRAVEDTGAASNKHGLELLIEADRTELRKSVEMAIKLGYSTIAFNHILPKTKVENRDIINCNPCHGARPVFPDLDPRTSTSAGKTILQLSRLTVMMDEGSITGGKGASSLFTTSNASVLSGYNLISVQPLDSAAFTHVCINMATPGPSGVDIIALDLATSPRLPFQLKRSLVLKAIADGAFFEISYGPALQAQPIPKEARRNVIAGARELIRVTNGKGIILSSEVRRCFELRGPVDLCNLGTILGFKPDQAKAALEASPRLAVLRGHANRGTYRGVISNPEIVPTEVDLGSAAPVPSTGPVSALQPVQSGAGTKRKRNVDDDQGRSRAG